MADDINKKTMRRLLYMIGVCSAGLIMLFALYSTSALIVFMLHLFVGLGSIWLGVANPLYAPAEEVFVCALLNLGLIAYPFVVVLS